MNFGPPSGPPPGPPPGYGGQPGGYGPPPRGQPGEYGPPGQIPMAYPGSPTTQSPGAPTGSAHTAPSGLPPGPPLPGYGGQPGGQSEEYGPPGQIPMAYPGSPTAQSPGTPPGSVHTAPSGPPPGPPPPGYGGQPGGQSGEYGPPGKIPMAYPGSPTAQSPGAPPGSAHTALSTAQDTIGNYEGLHYTIDHRDSNSIIRLSLSPGYSVKGKPGSMVCMAGTVSIQGTMKFSLSKMLVGGNMSESIFTGPGEVVLAPEIWGDIVAISVQPNDIWSVGKNAYLASTINLTRSTKSQGFVKGLMSGEGFFVGKVQGQGILFVQSLGAIIKRDLQAGEEWIVDNGHLVAWSASYSIERIAAGGGMFSASHTGEGAVCRFRGPGTVYIQTRNPQSLAQWVSAQVPARGKGMDPGILLSLATIS